MLSEMTAPELNEWRIRASLDSEVRDVMKRAQLPFAQAHKMVFDKYRHK